MKMTILDCYPKPTGPPVRCGDRVTRIGDDNEYMVCQVGSRRVAIICLNSGNRLWEQITVKNANSLTLDEAEELFHDIDEWRVVRDIK